jgi:hypothetical protein
MSTIANSKTSFLKRLEILQTGSHKSVCTLESEFLTKPENYTLQIEHFLVDITPTINLIEGSYLEVLRRPTYGETVAEDADALLTPADMPAVVNKDFLPVNPKTVLDVLSQLNQFTQLHYGLGVKLDRDMSITFTLEVDFGDAYYLKLNPQFATLMELPEYIYAFNKRDYTDDDWDQPATIHYRVSSLGEPNELFHPQSDGIFDDIVAQYFTANPDTDDFTLFAWSAQAPAGQGPSAFESAQTVRSLDLRLSYEVTCTFSSDSKVDILNMNESKKRLIARFPIGDSIETYADETSVSEHVNVGIEDLTRRNPNTQTLNLHNGEILIVNTMIEVRYLQGKEIKVVPADFGESGFFSIMLLFSKRIK